jgi:hypothetical protein
MFSDKAVRQVGLASTDRGVIERTSLLFLFPLPWSSEVQIRVLNYHCMGIAAVDEAGIANCRTNEHRSSAACTCSLFTVEMYHVALGLYKRHQRHLQ